MVTKEQENQIDPMVQDAVIRNNKTVSNLHSLTASLYGVTAGILGLESYNGFLLYLALSAVTTVLFYVFHVAPAALREGKPLGDTSTYFRGALDFWTAGVVSGLSGFVLTWTLFYGLVRV